MIVKIHFRVESSIVLDDYWSISDNGVTFNFLVDSRFNLVGITAIQSGIDVQNAPTISYLENSKVKASINVPSLPIIRFVQNQLRIFQGLLSAFGRIEIKLEEPRLEWIPENEEEREKIILKDRPVRLRLAVVTCGHYLIKHRFLVVAVRRPVPVGGRG